MQDGDALVFITDYADQGVILPLIAVVTVLLGLCARWRLVWMWVGTIACVFGAILALKTGCYVWGMLFPSFGLQRIGLISPSGHVASSCVAYSGIVAVVAGRERRRSEWLTLATSVGVAVVVGVTRVVLNEHSSSEVAVGAVVGIIGALAFARLVADQGELAPRRLLLVATAAVMLLFHGMHFSIEGMIHSASAHIFDELG